MIAITNILTSLGAFLLLPVITKTLGAYDYGIWAQISVTVSLLSSIALMGLSMALIRFLAAEKDGHRIKEGFYSISVVVALSGFITSLIVFALADFMAITIFSDAGTSHYIKAGSFLILLTSLDQIVMFYFRIFRQIRTYALITLFNTFGRLALILGLLHIGLGLMGVIAAVLFIQVAVFLGAISCIINQIGFAIPKFTMIKEYLRYGLPLTPNSLIRWITDSSDRYIVGILLGMNAVGIYSAAYAIGSLVQLLVTPIQLILFPELSKMYDENRLDEVKLYLSYSLKYFLLLGIPSVVGMSVLSRAILEILTKPEFSSGSSVIPFVALAGLMGGVFQIVININFLVKRTTSNLFIHIIAAATNIILNVMLIPLIGILGSAIATFVAYLFMIIVVFYISLKYISFDICWSFIAKSIISSTFMVVIILIIYPKTVIDLFVSVIIAIIVYFIMILSLGGLSKTEIKITKRYFYKIFKAIKTYTKN
ncbi:MAG TPA: flippase [Lachnospiraceae bacterium]|nr:flippase [Lachnospiraceae bacterium]